MTWGKVDDKLHSHPKVDTAGLEAMGLWVLAMSYCVDQLTDGFLSEERAIRLVGDRESAANLAARLIQSGLWLKEAGGYRFHDWHTYQPTAESVRSERDRKAKNVSAHRSRRGRPETHPRPVTDHVTGYTTGNQPGYRPGYTTGYTPVVLPAMLPVRNHGPDPDPEEITKAAAVSSQFQPGAREPQNENGGGGSESTPEARPLGAATEPTQGEPLGTSDGQGPIPEEIPPVKAKPGAKPGSTSGGLADVWQGELRKHRLTAHLADDGPTVQLLAARSFDLKLRKDRVPSALEWAIDKLEVKSVTGAGGGPLSHEVTMNIITSAIRGEVTKRHKAQARGEADPGDEPSGRIDCFTLEQRRAVTERGVADSERLLADRKAGKGYRW